MKKPVSFIIWIGLISLINPFLLKGQITRTGSAWVSNSNVITTTVPFLLITPDARAGGMADAGVATSPDANAMYWNPAKLAFEPEDMGFSLSYTPWLRALVGDVSLSDFSMYKKIGKGSAFSASVKYFSLGDATFTDTGGNSIKTDHPFEFTVDAGYGIKLSPKFSIGAAVRYIYSDLGTGILHSGESFFPAKDIAADISCFYSNQINIGKIRSDFALGCNISNIGPKISYTNSGTSDFIPMNLKLGGYLNLHLTEKSDLGFALDFNKLLIPTPPLYLLNIHGEDSIKNGKPVIKSGMDPNVSVFQGMAQSFYDAPGGFSEEMDEINPSFAVEYIYNHQFAFRTGYFYESPMKGNRQYITFGLGAKYKGLAIDMAYLVPTNSTSTITVSPLENTFRFTLSYNIGKKSE